MNRTRLARLRALTRGAALLGLGAAACTKPQSAASGTVMAPMADAGTVPPPTSAQAASAPAPDSDGAPIPFHRRGPILNAPRWRRDSGIPAPPPPNPTDPSSP